MNSDFYRITDTTWPFYKTIAVSNLDDIFCMFNRCKCLPFPGKRSEIIKEFFNRLLISVNGTWNWMFLQVEKTIYLLYQCKDKIM